MNANRMAAIVELLSIWLTMCVLSVSCQQWQLCSEWTVGSNLDSACMCVEDEEGQFVMNCDHLWLDDGMANVPARMALKGYSQRYAGLQTAANRLAPNGSLLWMDLSDNRISKLDEGMFVSSLEEVYLRNNWLGDQLNPVFTTESLAKLRRLTRLDLGGNRIRAIDDGLFESIQSIQHLQLDQNQLVDIPVMCLKKLANLHTLELQNNHIGVLTKTNYSSTSLSTLNLSSNIIERIMASAFHGLTNLTTLDLSANKISSLDSDIFNGLTSLVTLDLSDNYIKRFPSRVLPSSNILRDLRLASNQIRELHVDDFLNLTGLFNLDLARNRIGHLPPNVFSSLTSLRSLDMSVNLIRKLDQTHLTGLPHLRYLNIMDNTLLGWPTSTLGELQTLDHLSIGYNRIAAISPQLLDTAKHVTRLDLRFNLLREIPNATFHNFHRLQHLVLRGNRLSTVAMDTFTGSQSTLTTLDLSYNDLDEFALVGDYPQLTDLKISNNKIGRLSESGLDGFPSLTTLDVGHNMIADLPVNIFGPLSRLSFLDLSHNNIKTLKPGLFEGLRRLETLDVSNNALVDIEEDTFVDLPHLRRLNLANSGINNVHHNAFATNLSSLSMLNLTGNYLTTLDIQQTMTALTSVDLSRNHLQNINPAALKNWPNVRKIDLSLNRLTQLDGVTSNCPKLETLLLRNNLLQRVESGQFGHGKRLRVLDMSENALEDVEEGAFRGSTQIRRLNLSFNKLSVLNEGSFNEMALLDIDLGHNSISSLPPTIFSSVNVRSLMAIRMSDNRLDSLPMTSLDHHVTTLDEIDVTRNAIAHVTPNSNILSSVKRLVIAHNPLTTTSLHSIFTEPKMVQHLDVSNCSVEALPALETPFLRRLNLSANKMNRLTNGTFRRATLLEHLDISNNRFADVETDLGPIWSEIPDLRTLNISGNRFKSIGVLDFKPLKRLEVFDMSRLAELSRLGDEPFKYSSNLKHLSIYGYPRLGFYDLRGLLETTNGLESLEVEIKGSSLRDQLHPAFNPRLTSLSVTGVALDTLTSVSLAGLVARDIGVKISGTNVTQIPSALFLPLPMSSRLRFNVSNNQISTVPTQLLVAIDEKKNRMQLTGLQLNPIRCDCHLRAFHRWLIEQILRGDETWRQLRCHQPLELLDRSVWTLEKAHLTCEKPPTTSTVNYESTTSPSTTTAPPTIPTTTTVAAPTLVDKASNEEPDIIYEAPATKTVDNNNLPTDPSLGSAQSSLTNMDSMIIGIIVGVVAFVCILIIIICILKLRHSHDGHMHPHHQHHYPASAYMGGRPPSNGPGSVLQGVGGGGGASSCTCISGSTSKEMMMNGSHYELSSKMQMAAMNDGRQRHHRNSNYYVPYPDSENGCR